MRRYTVFCWAAGDEVAGLATIQAEVGLAPPLSLLRGERGAAELYGFGCLL